MSRLKRWIIPVLTCLTVAAAALAPQQLSALRDRQLSDAVHTEALNGDNNFSVWNPTLEERIGLLTEYESYSDSTLSVYQQMEGAPLREAEQTALAQLAELTEAGIFPPDTVPKQLSSSFGEQLYLWTPGNLGGAVFYRLSLEDTARDWFLSLVLDAESGKIVQLGLYMHKLGDWLDWPEFVGISFLDWLGVDYELYGAWNYDATFTIQAGSIAYHVSQDINSILITPCTPGALGIDTDLPGPDESYIVESILDAN